MLHAPWHDATTCGDYSDVPYVSPLAGSVFCDAVARARIHRLPERLMTGARSAAYMAAPDTPVHDALAAAAATTATQTRAPELHRALHTSERLRDGDGDAVVVIRDTATRVVRRSEDDDGGVLLVDVLDARDIDVALTRLLRLCVDDVQSSPPSSPPVRLVIANADVHLDDDTAACALSLLLLGVAAALHTAAATRAASAGDDSTRRVLRARVEMTVLATTRGALAADALHAYCEDVLHLAVRRVCDDGDGDVSVAATHARLLDEAASCIVTPCGAVDSSVAQWCLAVSERVVEVHEQLCDEPAERDGKLRRPVVVVVVPHVRAVRSALCSALGDSYTSEPLHIISGDDDVLHTSDVATQTTPLVLLVSSAWVTQQARVPRGECLLRRMNVQCIVHGGYVDVAAAAGATMLCDEHVHMLTLLQQLTSGDDVAMHVCTHGTLAQSECAAIAVHGQSAYTCTQELANVLLLLTRRVLLRVSPHSLQPQLTLTARTTVVLHDTAWQALVRLVARLHSAGVVQCEAAAVACGALPSSLTLELTALGRVLSRRFRVQAGSDDDTVTTPWCYALTCVDVKALLWAHLLRQSRDSVVCLLRDGHVGDDEDDDAALRAAVDAFYAAHAMHDAVGTSVDYSTLVRQLARFALVDDEGDGARVHRLLAAPHGRRCSVRAHLAADDDAAAGAAPTRCRGWCSAAPLLDGVVVDGTVRAPVRVSCPPPLAVYCEVSDASGRRDRAAGTVCVQCPVELSLPLLLVHCVLHISLHNNAVLCESGSSEVAQLPLSLLQAPEMHAVLQGVHDSNNGGDGGRWLDGCVASLGTLPPSSADMLSSLTHTAHSYIALCRHGAAALTTRKRQHGGSSDDKDDDGAGVGVKRQRDADAFGGTRPRSATEAEAVSEFVKLVHSIGQERAERAFRGKRGFAFLDRTHELHAYYLHALQQQQQ